MGGQARGSESSSKDGATELKPLLGGPRSAPVAATVNDEDNAAGPESVMTSLPAPMSRADTSAVPSVVPQHPASAMPSANQQFVEASHVRLDIGTT